ncbi:MAG TPA: hypothetical protein VHA07_09985 [Devosia sp.]|nr:hypothetical protein [Devosia sp.]
MITSTMASETALFGSLKVANCWRNAGRPAIDLTICAAALKTALRSTNAAIRRRAEIESVRLITERVAGPGGPPPMTA